MELIVNKKHSVILFDSIDELQIERFNAFNRFVMLDAEVGGTIFDYDRNNQKLIEFLAKGMYPEALQEVKNNRLTIWNVLQGSNPNHYSFACLVKSIDGKECTGVKQTDLDEVIKKLMEIGITQGNLTEAFEAVKKK